MQYTYEAFAKALSASLLLNTYTLETLHKALLSSSLMVQQLTWDVEEVAFVVVHHELDDDPGALAVVLQADDAHYVAQVLHV